jgi:hypothetical protein
MNPDVFITIAFAGPVVLAGITVALLLLRRYRAAQSVMRETRADLTVKKSRHATAR